MIVGMAQRALKQLGLRPPPVLLRAEPRPWENPWRGRCVMIGGAGMQTDALTAWLKQHGAQVCTGTDGALSEGGCDTVIFSALAIDTPEKSVQLQAFFHKALIPLKPQGRIFIVAPSLEDAQTPDAYAARYGLHGFMRSLAKEMGPQGTTVHLLFAPATTGGMQSLQGALSFLGSPRAAFVTGQVLSLEETIASAPAQGLFQRQEDVALITGAAGGIGTALSHVFAREGCEVALVDHPSKEDALKSLAEEVRGTYVTADLSTSQGIDAIVRRIPKPLRAIIHNAGITRDRTLKRMREEEWQQVVNLNFSAITRLQEALWTQDLLNSHSRAVNISSLSGWAGNFGQTQYAYSKSALLGYTEFLAQHPQALAQRPQAKGMRVNAVVPGFINTPMTAAMPFMTRMISQRLASLAQAGEPEDVAQAALFLASDLGAGCTGQRLRVCGGHLLGA